MKRRDRRLEQVERIAERRQQSRAPRYDVSDLSPMECYELDTLLARAGAASPQEEWAKVPLTPEEEARLVELRARVRVAAPGSQ